LGTTQWKAWAKNHAENRFSLFTKKKKPLPFVEEKFCFQHEIPKVSSTPANKNHK
jgi:hypothetical protein